MVWAHFARPRLQIVLESMFAGVEEVGASRQPTFINFYDLMHARYRPLLNVRRGVTDVSRVKNA